MPNPPIFQPFDPRKLREQTLYDNYGLTAQGFDPSSGMVNNPAQGFDPSAGMTNNPVGMSPNIPPQDISVKPPSGVLPTPSIQEMMDQMGGFDNSKQDAYNSLLARQPQRESPGIARRLVAAGMGLGSNDPLKTQEGVMYAPHARAMEDWASQVEPSYRAAQLENTSNANERQLRGNILTNKTNMDRYEAMNQTANDRNDITRTNNERNAKIQEQKIQADQAWRMGYTFSVVGNKLMAHAPDGSSYEAGEAADYSPLEIARMRHQYTMEEIGKRTEGAVEVKGTPSGTPPSGGPAGNPVVQRNMRFQNVYDNDQDAAQWLIPPATTNGSWQFKPEPKGGMLTGSNDLKRQKDSWNRARQLVNTPTPTAKSTGIGPSTVPKGPNQSQDQSTGIPPGAQVEYSPSIPGAYRYSTDGGQTWTIVDKSTSTPPSQSTPAPTSTPSTPVQPTTRFNAMTGKEEPMPHIPESKGETYQSRTNAMTGRTEYTHDGGKTWQTMPGTGYKREGMK